MSVKTRLKATLLAAAILSISGLRAQSYTEGFTNISNLTNATGGWTIKNNSSPVGTSTWVQGVATNFTAYNGANTAYASVNFNSTGSSGTISNWFITPNRTYRNGDVFSFYTRIPWGTEIPDRLEVRLSTNGTSSNVGTTATDVGDYSTLLLSVNPTLTTGVYPKTWTRYSITISGLTAPTSGRIAFRYYVTGAGSNGANSNLIAIDEVTYTAYTCPTLNITPGTLDAAEADLAYSQAFAQTGALGTPNFSVTGGALPAGITLATDGTLSGTATEVGNFNFTATVKDNSGCLAAVPFSFDVHCPANPVNFDAPAALCADAAVIDLVDLATPAGGTFSGMGINATEFDPAAGTQTATYAYTGSYGCEYSREQTITVNPLPVVMHDPANVCENGGTFTIAGASPAGGTYTGAGVTGSDFDPAAGTQTINYAYTDANGCSAQTDFTITVNTPPAVTHEAVGPVCENGPSITLAGGSPAGGTYMGTGITGNDFNPAAGTQTLTYAFTDANGCSAQTDLTVTVNPLPAVTHDPVTPACANAAPFALAGGLPAGGSYAGTGVNGNNFDPTAGTQALTYTFTDANGCSAQTDLTITVNPAPTVTHAAVEAVCADHAPFALAGGLPAGGTYTGTGVNGGNFDPAMGSQSLTYSYTDANGCSAQTGLAAIVTPLPAINLDVPDRVCVYGAAVTLQATPAGGTYAGTGVNGNQFNPAVAGAGNPAVTYTYTDNHGCTNQASENIEVSGCLGVDEENASPVAINAFPNPSAGEVTLSLSGMAGPLQLEMLDVQGKTVYRTQITATENEYTHKLDLSTFANGIYYLKVLAQGNTQVLKLIKQ